MKNLLKKSSIRFQFMLQTVFFALIFFIFTSTALYQLFNFTQNYAVATKQNDALQLAAGRAISAAKQMDWLIQRILMNQYRGNFGRLIARQSKLLESMADFEMFIEALNWGSESPVFKNADGGIHYERWLAQGWDRRMVLKDIPESIRQYAGTAHLYYTAFMRYTNRIVTHIQGYLNSVSSHDHKTAETQLKITNRLNKKIERFENLGSLTLQQLIDETNRLNLSSLETLRAQFKQTLIRISIISALLLFILLIVNRWVFGRLIAQPLENLTSSLRKIDAEGLHAVIPLAGQGEIASLSSGFNELITHLRHTTVKRDALLEEIQKHKETEAKLVAANQALEEKRTELTFALENLQRSAEALRQSHMQLIEAAKMESVGRLAAGVAHEVKNPLFIIQMGIDYLNALPELHQPGRPEAEIIKDISVAVERAGAIIRGLLNFSTPHELAMEECSLNQVIEDALHFLKHMLSSHHTQVIKSLDPSIPKVFADPQKLQQVFINLFMNSIQAMPTTGALTILTRHTRDTDPSNSEGLIVTEVMDSGTGFTEKSLQRAFDPFYTTKPTGQGTGLGLAVCKKIIEVHGGSIAVDNRKEGGAKITVQIPVERRYHHEEAKNTSRR